MLKPIAKTILFSFLCLQIVPAHAQFYPVRRYSVEDGLAHSNVFRVFQDKKGFLWLGTDYGLSRFDGTHFFNYTSSEGLSFNSVMSVSEGPQEEKLVCTYGGGINLIRGDSVIRLWPEKKGINPQAIIYSLYHSSGIWIIEKSGNLFRFRNGTTQKIEVRQQDPFRHLYFRRMLVAPDGGLLFSSSEGLFQYQQELDTVLPVLQQTVNDHVYAIQYDRQGALWLALKDKLLKIQNGKIQKEIKLEGFSEVSDMLVDKAGKVWLASPGKGIWLFEDKQITDITQRLQLQQILVNDLFEDNDGNIWIATHGSGLYCVRSLNIINHPVEQGQLNNYATHIQHVGNSIFVGSIGTVSELRDGQYQMHTLPFKQLLSSDFVYFTEQDEKYIYAGIPRGLLRKDKKNGAELLLPAPGAISFHAGADGKILIGCYSGLGVVEGNTIADWGTNSVLNKRRINCILSDHKGDLLLGTDYGLFRMHDGLPVCFLPGSNQWQNTIHAVYEDRMHKLWLATDEGLCCVSGKNCKWYTRANGLGHNQCNTVTADKDGNIWVATMGGLYRLDASERLMSFDFRSGLISNEVLSLYFDSCQDLWVGTVNGITHLLHNALQYSLKAPRFYITRATASGRDFLFPQYIELRPGDEDVHIEFTAVDYIRGDEVEFQYQLVGRQDNWLKAPSSVISLSALSPGMYDFALRARYKGNTWGKPFYLHVLVPTPYRETWWFRILVLSVATGILYVVLSWWILRNEKGKQERVAMQDKMLYLKQQALTILINPHFVFNCLNSIQTYIYRNENKLANKYLVQFSRLIRLTLDHAKETYINLHDEKERLQLYLAMEQLRFGERLRYTIFMDPAIDVSFTFIPNMILQPYVENSIKHGIMPKQGGGHIEIHFELLDAHRLKVIIRDDGIGISGSMQQKRGAEDDHKSLGMQLTEERLQLLGQLNKEFYEVKVYDWHKSVDQTSGTEVCLIISFKKKPAEPEAVKS